jgi:hypothetical protein
MSVILFLACTFTCYKSISKVVNESNGLDKILLIINCSRYSVIKKNIPREANRKIDSAYQLTVQQF